MTDGDTPDDRRREHRPSIDETDVPRRTFLTGLAAAGALGAASSDGLADGVAAESTATGETGWEPAEVPFGMETPWTSDVGPENARPEYPRPQMVREEWRNLNGVWQFAGAAESESPPIGEALGERILVPYPVESPLSGIARHETWMWYRRRFEVPDEWIVPTAHSGNVENNPNAQRLLVHFERVDWEATVYVNGEEVARHKGGYDHFVADVTDALVEDGPQELVVGVYDPTGNNTEPIGTQPKGRQGVGTGYGGEGTLWMTPTSGIWDTVWMEPVAEAHIEELQLTPDLGEEVLRLTAEAPTDDATVVATAYDEDDEKVGRVTGPVNEELELPVPDPRPWSPDDPFLYDLEVELRRKDGPGRVAEAGGGKLLDRVESYFGMRSFGMREIGGVARPTLNGELFYPIGTLDSGQWPDGLYAAPTDEALVWELRAQKELGYNMVRKHGKVETRRWFSHADRLGLLVWQDMPNMEEPAFEGLDVPWEEFDRDQFETELRAVVDELDGHPSMSVWIPFNEGWGIPAGDVEYVSEIADKVAEWDPERLVNPMSGYNKQIGGPNRECGCGDVNDVHEYPGPIAPEPEPDRISALGEFTTPSYGVEGHVWGDINTGSTADRFVEEYVEGVRELRELVVSEGLSASVYTATTDLENVGNGLITYDREVVKPDRAPDGVRQVREAHDRLTGAAADLMANVSIDISVPDTYPSGGLLGSSGALELTATLENPESAPSVAEPVEDVAFDLGLPDGWTVADASGTEVDAVENGESATAIWEVVPDATTAGDATVEIGIDYGVAGERFRFADERSMSASLLAYYRFEGNFRDSSTYSNAGVPVGGASTDDVAIEGQSAMVLDGEDDYVLLAEQGDHFLSDAFARRSVSTWIRPESTDGVQCIYNEGGIYNGFGLRIEDGSLVAGVSNNGALVTTSAPFDRTEWTHVVAIFDEGMLRLYVNGEEVAANEDVGFDTVPGHVGGAEIGSSTTTTPWGSEVNFFGGHVDATAIFADALSEDAIETLGSLTFSVDAPASYDAGGEGVPPESFALDASLSDLRTDDGTGSALENVSLTVVDLPDGWTAEAVTPTEFDAVPNGEAVTATWEITPETSTRGEADVTVDAVYDLGGERRRVTGGAVLSPVRIAHWPLDGTTEDATGSGHDASLENGAAFDDQVAVRGGYSVALDGDDDFVDLAEGGDDFLSQSFTERTVTTWVRPETTAGSQVLYNEGAAAKGLVVRINDGALEAATINSGTAVAIEAPFDRTEWTHVAVVFDRGAFRLYVDGTEVAANEDVGFASTSGGYWGGELGGAEVAYWTGNFAGHVDESAIYREALSADRIAALANAV
ncbi:LamG-like jellyroll fold domain-containing protein [Halosolutus gelatinilyticus]|uniref:LamG-like jellyroll fold domain-containing protein n=1 Tax=Halosolutus gelatinilyticus TaxID=2931975 RepID=UPI001FF442C4|nr:LamG-like jellyroll fold domain-containing protein [Halosolutus gelatinilyticus]